MPKDLALAIAAGLVSALLFLSMLTGAAAGLLFTYVAPLPVIAVGLALGLRMATVAAAVGAMAVMLPTGVAGLIPYAAAVLLPGLLLTRQALLWRDLGEGRVEWFPVGLIVAWLCGAGLVMLGLGAAYAASGEAGIEGAVRQVLVEALAGMAPNLTPAERGEVAGHWAPFLPAAMAGAWLVSALVNGGLAQWLVEKVGRNIRPTPDYRELELPVWMGVALPLALATGMMAGGDAGFVAGNVAVLLALPFVMLGLAGLHRAVAGRRNAGLILAAAYGMMLISGVAIPVIAALGFVRHWTRLRRAKPGGGTEDE
ncbi:MAG: DUF2232 domain-containing protein [Alphaproteobacteria bacterium]|nr:DUF2232 domain-containing protein [Alphaproteobacteria bacterium]